MQQNQKKPGDLEQSDALPNVNRTSMGEAEARDSIPGPGAGGAIDRTLGSANLDVDADAAKTAGPGRGETDEDPNKITVSDEPITLAYGGDGADKASTPKANLGTNEANTYLSDDTAVPGGSGGEGMGHLSTTAGGTGDLNTGASGTGSGAGSTAGGAAGSA